MFRPHTLHRFCHSAFGAAHEGLLPLSIAASKIGATLALGPPLATVELTAGALPDQLRMISISCHSLPPAVRTMRRVTLGTLPYLDVQRRLRPTVE